jgi:hypothetical protein
MRSVPGAWREGAVAIVGKGIGACRDAICHPHPGLAEAAGTVRDPCWQWPDREGAFARTSLLEFWDLALLPVAEPVSSEGAGRMLAAVDAGTAGYSAHGVPGSLVGDVMPLRPGSPVCICRCLIRLRSPSPRGPPSAGGRRQVFSSRLPSRSWPTPCRRSRTRSRRRCVPCTGTSACSLPPRSSCLASSCSSMSATGSSSPGSRWAAAPRRHRPGRSATAGCSCRSAR